MCVCQAPLIDVPFSSFSLTEFHRDSSAKASLPNGSPSRSHNNGHHHHHDKHTHKKPAEGDIIYYKIVELSPSFEPITSDYRVRICAFSFFLSFLLSSLLALTHACRFLGGEKKQEGRVKKIKTKDKKDTIIIAPTVNSAIPQRVPEDDGPPEYMPPYNQDGVLRVGFRSKVLGENICVCGRAMYELGLVFFVQYPLLSPFDLRRLT